jgi:hypothetical protein
MNEEQLHHFKEAWSVLDPQATGFIPAHRIEVLLKELMPPLGECMQNDHRFEAWRTNCRVSRTRTGCYVRRGASICESF